ncbi:MAG TPA: PLD nuclease N-terminal domain-containing protein [Propionibacteriaceae bacterium]|nr:PLD nuclease N-terminal domain-containing protein [Propionibacteriaceae bacterium]HPZ48583.1 PLD nuclease N-terminal domain-containing protein [Propionibacteriaceae bacterium]HQE32276.1 PLD nuclease N-terminal domain-containing protein [Propionibacteriaceae bacterium]
MIRYLPVIASIVLTIYALIDCVQVPDSQLRSAPKWAWVALILFFPIVGAVVYLVAGRPLSERRTRQVDAPRPRPRPMPIAPDDDPTFLASIRELNVSHERVLDEWEADLRRREQELKDKEQGDRPDEPSDPR